MAFPIFLPHEVKALEEVIKPAVPNLDKLSEEEIEAISNHGVLKSKGHYYLGKLLKAYGIIMQHYIYIIKKRR